MHVRIFSSALVLVLSAVTFVRIPAQQGQQPKQQTPPAAMTPEQQKTLESILAAWEKDAKTLQSLCVTFAIEEEMGGFSSKNKSFGQAKVMRMPTGSFGLKLEICEVDKDGKPDLTRIKSKYICSGIWLYNFDYAAKVIHAQRLFNQNMRADDGPLAFLVGMKATDSKSRFDMSVFQEDQEFTWIRIKPLTAQDQKEFTIAQLGVAKKAYPLCPQGFPYRISYRDTGNNLKKWDFISVIRNDSSKVDVNEFNVEAEKRQGWSIKEVASPQSTTPPRK